MNDQNFDQNSYVPPVSEAINLEALRPRLDLRAAFGSGMFLAICILTTILTVVGSFTITLSEGEFSTSYGVDVLTLLITIGLWITYSSAKSAESPLKKSGLTMVSGTIKAIRILTWVSTSIILVSGVIIAVAALLAPDAFYDEFVEGVREEFNSAEFREAMTALLGQDFIDTYLRDVDYSALIPIVLVALGIILCFTMVIALIFNVTFYKRLHQFAKSMCRCAEDPDALPEHANTVAIWLLVLGILSIFSGLTGVVMILGYVFIKKYIVEPAEM